MELTITTPALLFPAISLMMLAYTNRFLAIASLIRTLHEKYKKEPGEKHLITQIENLRIRVRLIRLMQTMAVLSFLLCVICMYTIFMAWSKAAFIIFAVSIISFAISLITSLIEITISTRALEVALSDIEDLSNRNLFSDILGHKENRERY
jgi:hypothetical protein